METMIDAKWKIKKQELIDDFYKLARPALYTSKEVAIMLSMKYACIHRDKIEQSCRTYRQNRYTDLELIIDNLMVQI